MNRVVVTLLFGCCAALLCSACTTGSAGSASESMPVSAARESSATSVQNAGESAAQASNEPLEKVKSNLGFLEDADGNLVLLMNTEVDITTVRESLRSEIEDAAREQLLRYHCLIDSHHFYNGEDGTTMHNVAYLNEHIGEGPIAIDEALFNLIEEAIDMAELTQGYFNPTVGKLSQVYEGRFSATGEVAENPNEADLTQALQTVVPYDQLRKFIVLNRDALTVELLPFEGREFSLTLSAIGKGFALNDLVFEHDTSYLITAGSSSIRTHAAPGEDSIGWNVATRVPDEADLLLAFALNNGCVSVSGDDENYYLTADGTRVHHILNPFTGQSENFYRTVILTGEDAGVLDALSTALFNVADEQVVLDIIARVEEHYGIHVDYCFVRQDESNQTFKLAGNQEFFDSLLSDYLNERVDSNITILG